MGAAAPGLYAWLFGRPDYFYPAADDLLEILDNDVYDLID